VFQIRGLAVFINASPQRREAFLNLQTEEPKLVPIQDVRTRWNSTFLMLRRARRLSSVFNKYCIEHDQPQFKLNTEEWRQIDYLLHITQPFYKWTTGLSKIKDVTIHNVFRVYNKLFDHLETSIRQLERKKVPWKQAMLRALYAGKEKLTAYYAKTEQIHGHLYAIATILAPQHKLQFFSKRDWADNDFEWRTRYKESLEKYLEPYSQRQSDSQLPSAAQPSSQNSGDMEVLFADDIPQASAQPKMSFHDELTRYLESGIYTFIFCPRYILIDYRTCGCFSL
jgi:hypothetical protein